MTLFGPPNVQQLEARGNIQGLIKALDYDQDPSVRMEAARALGQIGDSRAVHPLIERLMDVDGQVVHKAQEALSKIGAPAIPPLLTALKNEDKNMRQRAAEALGMFGIPAAGLLLSALKDDDPHARAKAVVASFGDGNADRLR